MAKTKRKTKADLEAELSAAGAELSASEAEKEELGSENKRQKMAISSVAKEFVCPISFELPVDPVTAADGRVYNRASIQTHIDKAKKDKNILKSPITNEPMNDTLVPAVQVMNTIRALIESGAVDGDLAQQWKKVDDTKKKAENGDAKAMVELGCLFCLGCMGILKDEEQAYKWFEKSANLDNTDGMTFQGICLCRGQGVPKNDTEGTTLLGIAAGRGNARAAFKLGRYYFQGTYGLKKNNSRAKHLLTQSINARRELHLENKLLANKYLKEIENGE